MVLRHRNKRSLGFTLIELAIVLGVVGVLSAGLWRLMSTGNQQSKDQITAQQQTQLINAVKGYLQDMNTGGGQVLLKGMAAGGQSVISLPASNASVTDCQTNGYSGGSANPNYNMCLYLPSGFTASTTNPYGHKYAIRVMKDNTDGAGTPASSYSFMIVSQPASASQAIPDTDGGRISGMIGGDGGFVYQSTAICGKTSPYACGSMGAWNASVTGDYGFAATQVQTGVIASRTFVTSASDNSLQWLARVPIPNDTTLYTDNTMSTDLIMGTWQGSTATPLNLSATGPGLHLQNGYLDGWGTGSINPGAPQINLNDPNANTDSSYLMQLSTHCSALDAATPSCPAAINVAKGDIQVAGEITALKIYSASDARLKTGIVPLHNALGDLMKIDPVAFTFADGGSKSMGVIAQNLESVYPQLVTEKNGTKYVEYNGLIGPLIGAVQELKQQNDALREELRRQSLREERLERELHRQAP